jgi:cytidine deaminase
MVHAQAAALRSCDLSRQVGAVVVADGNIIAAGCNEVPRPLGGQYWCGETRSARDVDLGYDSNTVLRREAIVELYETLERHGATGDLQSHTDLWDALRGTRIANLTEFGRPVHAEMAAILDAARRGVPVDGHTMISTTFPCHNCARHLIAAGIREVIFREPYPKSLAAELHADAIEIDPLTPSGDRLTFHPFVGISPSRYFELFTMARRKDGLGHALQWDPHSAHARFVSKEDDGYLLNEVRYLDEISSALGLKDLTEGAS